MKRMICKHCGQEIRKQTNFDVLKDCRNENDVDEWIEKLCQTPNGCPFRKICAELGEVDDRCIMATLNEWLFEEAKIKP